MNLWKIKSTDTSYRFLETWDWNSYLPSTFCAYYRHILFIASLLFGVGWCVIVGLLTLILGPRGLDVLYLDMHSVWSWVWSISAGIGVFGLLVGLVLVVVMYTMHIGDIACNKIKLWWSARYTTDFIKDNNVSNPSIIKTWYKAYKLKFCPMVEFVRDSDD